MKVSRKESSKQLTEVIAAIAAAQKKLEEVIKRGDFSERELRILESAELSIAVSVFEELQRRIDCQEKERAFPDHPCPHGRIMRFCPSCARPHRFSNRKEVREEILKGAQS
jgi:hypothetical protein